MTEIAAHPKQTQSRQPNATWRIMRYVFGKIVSLLVVVVLSVFLIILIANYGGYIDEMVKGEIDFAVGAMFHGAMPDVPFEQRMEVINQTRESMYAAAGLNEPFMSRTVRWLWRGITLDFGSPLGGSPFFPTAQTEITIKQVLAERIPPTLTLFGSANLVIFFTSLIAGLFISRRYEKPIDRILRMLAPISAIPAWFHGILFGIFLPILGLYWPPLLLLIISLFLGAFFQTAYLWRSFFLIYSEEDYVDIAKAKGLSEGAIQWHYLIRPALPTILTNFALMLISLWMGSIVLEAIFGWPGIGNLLLSAISINDTSQIVSIVVVYAYMLAITIFILDISYAIVDPRVRLGGNGQTVSNPYLSRKKHKKLQSKPKVSFRETASKERKPDMGFKAWWQGVGSKLSNSIKEIARAISQTSRELNRQPPARRSLIFIGFLIAMSIYTIIAIPYDVAIDLWRGDGNIFIRYPVEALPEWVNFFREDKLPPNIIFDTHKGEGEKTVEVPSESSKLVTIRYPFDYPYASTPQDITLYIDAKSEEKQGLYIVYWQTPDGEVNKLADFTGPPIFSYSISQSEEVQRKIHSNAPEQALFQDGDGNIQNGSYAMIVETFLFEPDADVDIEFVARGRVYGLAGTDYKRRDIMVEILWGLPIVLAFGLTGAVATNIIGMLIAAAGAWYGGWVDGIIQRITELNLSLPAFPISLMVFVMYSKSIWTILTVTVLLSIFGSSIKSFRASFLQVRENPYIEAAQAYGASNRRIIFKYLLPRIISILVPQIIVAIPGFVFLEASLAFLGVSDPVFPTWGKLLVDTIFVIRGTAMNFDPENMAYYTHFYGGIILPAVLLALLAVSFNTLGAYLERVLNPRLKEIG